MTFESLPDESQADNDQAEAMPQSEIERMPVYHRRSLRGSDVLVGVLLILVLAAGAYFRFVGQNWDDYTHLHPDERFLTGVASSLGGALDPSGGDKAAAQVATCRERYPDTGGAATSIFDSQCSTWYPKNANS